MAFFPRRFYSAANDTSFNPLLRLLDDFDGHSRQAGANHCRRGGAAQWQPKFDVREVADAYELYGELPGINKQNVHIEFTEPQTLTVRGKTERTYTAGTPPTGHLEDATVSDASTKSEQENPASKHQATVEDDEAAEDSESTFEAIEKPQEESAPPAQAQPTAQADEQSKATDKAKYWLTERNIGGFSRSFNFPARVEQDEVSASFKDGILKITVPKAKKHESRRIIVN